MSSNRTANCLANSNAGLQGCENAPCFLPLSKILLFDLDVKFADRDGGAF